VNTQELLNNFARELELGTTLTESQQVEVMTDLVNAIYTTEKDDQ
jgi:hypothetical protein